MEFKNGWLMHSVSGLVILGSKLSVLYEKYLYNL